MSVSRPTSIRRRYRKWSARPADEVERLVNQARAKALKALGKHRAANDVLDAAFEGSSNGGSTE